MWYYSSTYSSNSIVGWFVSICKMTNFYYFTSMLFNCSSPELDTNVISIGCLAPSNEAVINSVVGGDSELVHIRKNCMLLIIS